MIDDDGHAEVVFSKAPPQDPPRNGKEKPAEGREPARSEAEGRETLLKH